MWSGRAQGLVVMAAGVRAAARAVESVSCARGRAGSVALRYSAQNSSESDVQREVV